MCTHFEGSEKPKRGHMENQNFFASGTNKKGFEECQNPCKAPRLFNKPKNKISKCVHG